MGDMQLSDFRTAVREEIGGHVTDEITDARVNRWVNWSYYHVAHPNVLKHREMHALDTFALIAGTRLYTLTTMGLTRFLAPVSVRNDTEPWRLRPKSVRKQDERDWTPQSRPRYYDFFYSSGELNIELVPTPSQADNVTVRYWTYPQLLAADNDMTVLLPHFDELIVVAGAWRGYRWLNQVEMAEAKKTEFGQLVNEYEDLFKLGMEDDGWEIEVEIQPVGRVA